MVFQFCRASPCSKMRLFHFIALRCIVFRGFLHNSPVSSTNNFSSVETWSWTFGIVPVLVPLNASFFAEANGVFFA